MLQRFERERVANTSNDPVLNRIAGEVCDEQFLEVTGLDKTGKKPCSLRFVEAGAESERFPDTGHSYGPDTWIALGDDTQLLGHKR